MADKKQFHKSFRGYNKDEVNAFILEFNSSYEQMEEYYRDAMRSQAAAILKKEEECKSLAAQLDATEDRLQQQEKAIAALQSEKEALQEENVALQSAPKADAAAMDALREANTKLEGEYAALQESFNDTVNDCRDAQKTILSLEEQNAALSAALAQAKEALEKSGSEAKESAARAKSLLEESRKKAEELIAKAKQTAQLIRISALRGEPSDKDQ